MMGTFSFFVNQRAGRFILAKAHNTETGNVDSSKQNVLGVTNISDIFTKALPGLTAVQASGRLDNGNLAKLAYPFVVIVQQGWNFVRLEVERKIK